MTQEKVLCKEREIFKILTFASLWKSNAKVLWIATRVEAFTLALGVLVDGAELESDATTSAVTTEVIADCWRNSSIRCPNLWTFEKKTCWQGNRAVCKEMRSQII
jgi:hypothetical protein